MLTSETGIIRDTFKRWVGGEGPDELYLDEPLIVGNMFSERARAVWRRLKNKTFIKNWLVTAEGRGWVSTFGAEILPRDTVVALRGLPEYTAVLRTRGEWRRIQISRAAC